MNVIRTLLGCLLYSLCSAAIAQCPLPSDKAPEDMSQAEINSHYQCSRQSIINAYKSKYHIIGKTYLYWEPVATGPTEVLDSHGDRYLISYVNSIGYEAYSRYRPRNTAMPLKTIVAAETYTIDEDNGEIKVGHLYIMKKVGLEAAPETGGWSYTRVSRKGKQMRTDPEICHDCHKAAESQDFLFYPKPAVRLNTQKR